MNLLNNGDFEGGTHDVGDKLLPIGWMPFWKTGKDPNEPENKDGYLCPEYGIAGLSPDPLRVHSGAQALKYFSYGKIHDGGVFQQFDVTPGLSYTFSTWVHAWSNRGDWADSPHPHHPRWSEGNEVGFEHYAAPANLFDDDDRKNIGVMIGVDVTGGVDAFAPSVLWTRLSRIYNGYALLGLDFIADAGSATVFLRSVAMWRFEHNDLYWDDCSVELAQQPIGQWKRLGDLTPDDLVWCE